MNFEYTENFAQFQDQQDPLKSFREEFTFPQVNGRDAIYFCGNSLGLQPKLAREYVNRELDQWANLGVEGHFNGERPWAKYHHLFKKSVAELVGAREDEVVIMNNLTTNLHLLIVSFYWPHGERYKILTEAGSFPSDIYALESQVKHHGYDPEDAILELAPREGEYTLREEDILAAIEQYKDELAMVLFPGIQYYTGQLMPMEIITKEAHRVGATVGFDLAHAAGNVPVELHKWNVDFAVWCTYKYLNSGPGSVGGAFVNERFAQDNEIPRFAGWWGYNESKRFKMESGFEPMYGADGWQLSNTNILGTAAHLASMELFQKAGIKNLRQKSLELTAYLEFVIKTIDKQNIITIITPENPQERGAQLSLMIKENGRVLFDNLMAAGVIGDWREPDVIRLAPTPMYNSFMDVYKFGQILAKFI
ncbi:kynureninase [Fulvivirgaceae bacterium LMO-SS25]